MRVKLTNNFHGTETSINLPGGRREISARSAKRIKSRLCPRSGSECCCSNYLGTRGGQVVEIDTGVNGYIVFILREEKN